jgi:hypothetical protein
VMSKQLTAEVDFGLPALAEESRLSGVVLHVAKIPRISPLRRVWWTARRLSSFIAHSST